MGRLTSMGFGWKKDPLDPRDVVFGVTHQPHALAASRSLREQMPPVYDQGELGSCTANAIAACMQFADSMQYENVGPLSRLFIYYHERLMEGTVNDDSGAFIRDGLKVVAKVGVPPETEWPYEPSKFAEPPPPPVEHDAGQHRAIRYARVRPGVGAPLRSAIASGHPVVFGFSVPAAFETLNAEDPVLHLPRQGEAFIGGHAVVATGWDFTRTRFDVNVIEVRNSWSESWGDAGYFYMDAQWFTDQSLTSDFWVIQKVS
jgi:C1A family cysteine protease